MNKFYLTTAIPYVNGKPHIGHALEYFQADTVRNYHRLLGEETLLLSGADENALKNVQKAEEEGIKVEEFLNRNSKVFEKAFSDLGIKLDVFQRGSDKIRHWPGVQKLWQLCFKNGDIYKKTYGGYYCVGCESFKTEKELVNGLCPEHQKKPELVREENYFFRLSKYQNQLTNLIETNELKIIPENKRAETLSFIKSGLEDFSISRSYQRAHGIGVPVPGDKTQIIYVWFDALDIYMTGIGFGINEKEWNKWWPADLHIIGKDINRFHTVYWPAMLLSAGLPLPKEILIHSFINSGGQKMSKTLGNVIDPFEIANKYGVEALRYYLLSQIPLSEDGDFTIDRFLEIYTADLTNGLGNLAARVAKLSQNNKIKAPNPEQVFDNKLKEYFKNYQFSEALAYLWTKVAEVNREINQRKPWELSGNEAKLTILNLIKEIQYIAFNLQPFLPQTAAKILNQFSGHIEYQSPLFPRIKNS